MEEIRRRKVHPASAIDFDDVFGGPPRTLFLWQPGRHSQSHDQLMLYEEIFGIGSDYDGVDHRTRADPTTVPPRRCRNLPVFMIPGSRSQSVRGHQGFYDDVFSLEARSPSAAGSGSRSRSTSDTASPHRPSIQDDVALSAVASLLKPIVVPSQRHRMQTKESSSENNTHGNLTVASISSYMDFVDPSIDSSKQSGCSGKFIEHRSSLSAQSLHNQHHFDSHSHVMKSAYDKTYCNPETNTPSSVTMSVVNEPESFMESDKGFRDDEGEEFMGSCMIEIVPGRREVTEKAGAVDDAIAWAKEKFRTGKLKNSEGPKVSERRNFI